MTERNLALTPARALTSALAALLAFVVALIAPAAALAADATVTLRTQSGDALPEGFRYTLEEDVTWAATPGPSGRVARDSRGAPMRTPDPTAPTGYRSTLAVELHKSYIPVARTGHLGGSDGNVLTGLDPYKRYYISVIPDSAGSSACETAADNCYTMSGQQIEFRDSTGALYNNSNPATGAESTTVAVTLTKLPMPTAQIYIRAFEDVAPINNVWDNGEPNLGGWDVFIYDAAGKMLTDAYGNPLGSTYKLVNDVPTLVKRGDGTLHTLSDAEAADPARNPDGLEAGELLIKNVAPGKYGIQVVPPAGQGWSQTATIEGTKGLDMWVKAGEPRYFAEFGPASHHGEFGFVRSKSFGATGTEALKALRTSLGAAAGSHTITGQVVNKHMSRPPQYDFFPGQPLAGCWVGLNDSTGTQGLYAAPCKADSTFSVPGVPDGTYQLVFWDDNLLNIFEMQLVTVAGGDVLVNADATNPAERGKIKQFGWFGTHHNYVFLDENGNGKRDPGEAGIPDQAVNLRYRDGSIYGGSFTDTEGFLPFEEVFPFFSWLVEEVDYARFKPTGLTVTIDAGGEIPTTGPAAAFTFDGRLNPQIQDDGSYQRTELSSGTGSPLLEGFNAFLGVTNVFEWGKQPYAPGENGGISGVIQYGVTRAENDPKFAAAETWEPGIPRVQVNLYKRDASLAGPGNSSGIVDVNGSGAIELADVDNYPFGWADGTAPKGPEDEDKNSLAGVNGYNAGDAIAVVHSDSFDDLPPTGCRPNNDAGWAAKDQYYFPDDPSNPNAGGRCYDGLRNYNQVRSAVFDGGYLFGTYRAGGASSADPELPLPSGDYVVEANAPRGADGTEAYKHQEEESKNVDFGDTFTVNPLALPPECVGDGHVIGDLSLFPGIESVFKGQERPHCDRKSILLVDGKNAGVNFFMYTDVPVTGHIQGFVLNDLANEFDPNSPNLGEKFAPSWIPVSVRDYAGNEVYHTYTDEFGNYNAIVPSSYRINVPSPSGVSPNILQVCLNSPFMPARNNPGTWVPDPYHNKQYTQFCYTLNFTPGTTTYLDTPVLPISAFAGPHNWQLDCEQPDGTPTVSHVEGGPVVRAGQTALTIRSMGTLQVPDPYSKRVDGSNAELVSRSLGFGAAQGTVVVGGQDINPSWVSWTDSAITITCPGGCDSALRGGQLDIVSASGRRAVAGITIAIQKAGQQVLTVSAGQRIQDQIDLARPGDIVLVGPGSYQEMLVITKPIALQGWGAGVTVLNPVQSPTDVMARWRAKVNELTNCTQQFGLGLLPGQPNNTPAAGAPCGYTPGSGLLANEEGAGVLIAPREGVFTATSSARVDGFTITGADQSAGIIVNGYAVGTEISNNQVANNQGPYAAGIRAGQPALLDANELPVAGGNTGLRIHNNRVIENGGLYEPGAGIGLYTGSDKYQVTDNFVCGNFAQSNGGGIAHYGLSRDGLIADNQVLFNQAFDQTAATGGHGGGVLVEGFLGTGTSSPGAGNVTIERNTIIGNNAASGEGGGIALRLVNGADVEANRNSATNWFAVNVINNVIANNVAGGNAGGISLLDALNVTIANNTIANNDSSGSLGTEFYAHPAGVYSHVNVQAGLGGNLAVCPNGNNCQANQRIDKSFSNPRAFVNNIIFGNRANHWNEATTTTVATLVTDGFWNVAAEGGKALVPTYSLLGSSTFTAGANTTGACPGVLANNNRCANDLAARDVDTLFKVPYTNGDPSAVFQQTIQPAGTLNQPEFANAGLTGAAATDEGGNFIDVHYGPLTISATTQQVAPSYLLGGGTVATGEAENRGTPANARPTSVDIEAQPRVDASDIGADERVVGASARRNLPPSIGAPILWVKAGSTVSVQLVATDPDSASLTFSALTFGPANGNNRYPTTSRPTLSPTGLLTWTVPATHNGNPQDCLNFGANTASRNCLGATFTVSDGANTTAPVALAVTVFPSTASFVPAVRLTGGANPAPVTQTYAVDAAPLATAAPGLLTGFTGGSAPLTIAVGSATTPAYVRPTGLATLPGTANVAKDGSFVFTPATDFAGRATFTVRATDGVQTSAGALSVFLDRELAATSLRFVANQWQFSGKGVLPTLPNNWANRAPANRRRTLTFVRDASDADPVDRTLGTVNVTVDVTGAYVWSFTRTAGGNIPAFLAGDTVTITATATNNVADATLTTLAVLDGAADGSRTAGFVQCPIDTDHDGAITPAEAAAGAAQHKVCRHLAAGDGFAKMADGKELYTFGFSDVTEVPADQAIDYAMLNAQAPGPTLSFNEGDEVYLTLTNVGMLKRPDLFDAHTVHWHGFPNAGSVFDGVPDSSFGINMGFNLTYYYKTTEPGTYMYHCHVEATEHIQMGMIGNLYVKPRQNGTPFTFGGKTFHQFVYNDGDGSTGYDIEMPIQLSGMDGTFHDEHIGVQPLPFAELHDNYPLMNGRGYPDTVLAGDVPAADAKLAEPVAAAERSDSSQKQSSRITATVGQRILLRVSNLSTTEYFTIGTTGLPMQMVGTGAHILRGPATGAVKGKSLYFGTQSVTLGGGEGADVMIDTTGVKPGTYLLYSTNLNHLSNSADDFGGLMTEIVISAP